MAVAVVGTPVVGSFAPVPADVTGSYDATVVVPSDAQILLSCSGIDTSVGLDRHPTATSNLDGALGEWAAAPISGNSQNLKVFYKLNPTVGTHTITHNHDQANVGDHIYGIDFCCNGIDLTTPLGTAQTSGASVASVSLTVPSVGTDDLVVDFLNCNGNPTITVGANQTAIGGTPYNSGGTISLTLVVSTQPGSAGGVMSHSWTGSQRTSFIALAVKAATAAAYVRPTIVVPTIAVQRGSRW